MEYHYYTTEVIQVIDETLQVKRFILKMSNDVEFRFQSGQFIMLDLPIASTQTNRSFSIASAPSNNNIFEICIVKKEDGIGTSWIWENMNVGTHLQCTTALGKFMLPETIESDLCFIATGTGIAPVRSMVLDIYSNQKAHKNIYVVFGNRWIKDILYREEFEALQAEHPEFHFIPVLSRETRANWLGHIGYVHTVYEKLFEDRRAATFLLCGWNAIVKEARDRIKAMGYTKKDMKYELYD